MHILRVETILGGGPWNSPAGERVAEQVDGHFDLMPCSWRGPDGRRTHPGPARDAGLRDRFDKSYVLGLLDLAELDAWFPEGFFRDTLKQFGFGLSHYEVPKEHVLVGEYQVAFHRDHATLLSHDALP